ncbi:proactivator polypeptide-like [Histomonas meleagridis]|uniref:proactivator polypeptide-like n=1 Tax=Histomonas meleagridis TaxID=135588 RepID=UPI003559ECB0|nr:proactivator polypeptide-like [Histomonas meleagridis]KAH0807031.1 proactivator polypeptide-like [Histomonas meleagridis]
MFALLLISTLSSDYIEPIEIPQGLSNADACAICKTVVSGITNILDNTKVQSAIAQLAAQLCTKFSLQAAQNLCNTIITGYLPKVLSFISSGISKADICTKLSLCKSNDDEVDYIEIPEGLENGIACSICKHLVSGVSSILASTTVQTKVTEYAEKICARFPSIGRTFCNKIVSYIPNIMNWLSTGLTNLEVCTKIKICSSNDDNDDAYLELYLEMDEGDYVTDIELPLGLSNADNCAICKKAVSYVSSAMKSSTVQSVVKAAATAACSYITSGVGAALCKTIISVSIGPIMTWLGNKLSTSSVCTKLKICSSNADDEVDYIEIPEGLENGIACSICKHLVSGVSSILASTTVQTKVTEYAEKICARFPSIGRTFCNKIVSYIPNIMNWLSTGLTNLEVCTKIKICSSNDVDNDDAYLELYLEMEEGDYVTEVELPLGLSNADNCAICKSAVGFVSAAMGNSIVQAIVKAAATAACGLISGGVGAALCKTIVSVSVGPIMSWLSSKLSSSSICTKLGYCKSNSIDFLDFDVEEEDDDEIYYIPIPEGLDNTVACTVCTTVVTGISTIMKDTSVTSQIASLAANLCTKVPTSAQSICKTIINNYLPKVISWLGSGLSKSNICSKLSLC